MNNFTIMKLNKRGYRINKNGRIINSIEKDAIVREFNTLNIIHGKLTNIIKEDGVYYFLNRKQGNKYIYLP